MAEIKQLLPNHGIIRNYSYNLLNIASRSLNFLLFWVIVNKIGASATTDWFFFVYGFVYLFIGITFYSLECALVPIWPGLSKDKKDEFLGTCFVLGGLFLIALQVFGFLISLYLPETFGFVNPFSKNVTIYLSIFLFLQPFLVYFSALFSSLLQASGYYFLPITHLTWRTLGVLIILMLPTCSGIVCLTVAYTVGELFRLLTLFAATWKYAGRPPIMKRFEIRRYQNYFVSIGWMALMVSASALNSYVDFIMVGYFGDGGATLVEYSGRLRGLPLLALNGFMVVLLGDWSRLNGEMLSWKKIKHDASKIALWGLLLSGGLILCREYWMPLIFRPPQFDLNQLDILNRLMFWYLAGAPFMIAGTALSRGFLVWKRFKLLSCFSVISVAINIALNLIFIKIFGIIGVAVSTTGLDIFWLCFFLMAGKRIRDAQFLSERTQKS